MIDGLSSSPKSSHKTMQLLIKFPTKRKKEKEKTTTFIILGDFRFSDRRGREAKKKIR